MEISFYVSLLSTILTFLLIRFAEANFNMVTSKKYDHFFLDIYYTAFENHLNNVYKNRYLTSELENIAKEMDSGGLAKEWINFGGWKIGDFELLRQHFLFAVKFAKECRDIFPLIAIIYVKHQSFLHGITYMNGAILLPETDDRKTYCRAVATNLLSFSDVGTKDFLKKLGALLELKYTQEVELSRKIKRIFNAWAKVVQMMWLKYVPQMESNDFSKNSANDMEKLYQKLCDDQNVIILGTKIAIIQLFEGIKQGSSKPFLPLKERVTLNFATANSLWDKSKVMWTEHFQIQKGKFQVKEAMKQYYLEEMRMYKELNATNEQELKFDDLKGFNLLILNEKDSIINLAKINKETGIIELGKIRKEINIIELENNNQEKQSKKRKENEVALE